MAFSASIGDRGAVKSPREESSSFAALASPLRSVGTHIASASGSNDARGHLPRRFTTNNIPTLHMPLSPIGQQRRQAAEPEYTTATYHKLQVLEKKKLEYEYLKEQKRRFEAEMELIDLQSRREEEEIHRLSSDIQYGKHSQPTTPPEYSDSNGFPTALSRPNRFSMSSITPGVTTPRGSRSGSIMSPPSGNQAQGNGIPSKSVPGSRRGSDEEGDEFGQDDFAPLSPVYRNHNRMSMPVTSTDFRGTRNGNGNGNGNASELPDLASVLGHIDTTGYLFDDEERRNPAASPDDNRYLQMHTSDNFPILVRREGVGLSAAALDLALSQSPGPEAQSNGWPASRHRQAQQSLPTNTYRKSSQVEEYESAQANGTNLEMTPTKSLANNRRSVEFSFSPYGSESKRSSFASPSGVPKLQQSYSSNDVPTLKNGTNGMNGPNGMNGANGANGFISHAEQHLHNHNASMGRIPNGASSRHSRELSSGFKDNDSAYRPLQSGLHASATPFGPPITSAPAMNGMTASTVGSPTMSHYSTAGANAPYYGYGMNMINGAMNGLSLGAQVAPPPLYNQNGAFPGGVPYFNPYASYAPAGRVQDSQARVIQSRRQQNDSNRFLNYDLQTMSRAEIYALCKDQHGCRFLQKKLEEKDPESLKIIFEETAPHIIELMTDPFGNYLCQKLLEYANTEQRDSLVEHATESLVQIAFNQHGTRALQKMIEFISSPRQVAMITEAFADQVVELIQDLNGNHVIQKCLNHLKADEAQFIFDAVGQHCITVGTHRHGCCVLQRCIDHASGFQKVELVRQITANSFHLVQDPFGNYVVQYILDLNDPGFTTPLCIGFGGKVAELSRQKFSSNVIEKCIRCADMSTKRIMIEELMNSDELEKLMRDSYGNYVIQTALEFAPPDLCVHLIDSMRPILPAIRQTPYGRRIQSKVQERETRLNLYTGRNPGSQGSGQAPSYGSGHGSGHGSPHVSQGSADTSSNMHGSSSSSFQNGYNPTPNGNYGNNIAAPQPHRTSNPPLPNQLQFAVQNQPYQQYTNGMGNFF